MADKETEALRRRELIVEAVRFACFGGTLISAVVALAGPLDLAISIMLGTLFGIANFVLLARAVGAAIDRTVEDIERSRRENAKLDAEQVVRQRRNAGGVVRLAFGVLLLAGVLWYSPTQPLGLALGVIIVLIAASIAGARESARGARSEPARRP